MPDITIAGHEVTLDRAVDVLIHYEPETVRFYDLGGESPSDRVTLEDLGRMVAIAAELTADDAHCLMTDGQRVRWIEPGHSLIEAEPGSDIFERASQLFNDLDALPNIGHAKASKLLHIKHPALIPILDSEVEGVYEDKAKKRAALEVGKKRTKERRWWAVIRDDLIANEVAFKEIRAQLEQHDGEHARRLMQLTDLRLLDILAWRMGRDGV